MSDRANKQVLVLGLGARGEAACRLLARHGARVTALDEADTPALRETAERLRMPGVEVVLGARTLPAGAFDFAVLSPAVSLHHPLVRQLDARGVPILGVLELAAQRFQCLTIAITGTNGKGTTADLVQQVLRADGRRVAVAGAGGRPVCAVADETAELDYLILQLSAQQLETTRLFRPAVAVLLNLAADTQTRYPGHADYCYAAARVFRQQQPFDWAIVQSEALAQLRALGIVPAAKLITFSATDPTADLGVDRGLLVSRLSNWTGPLLDQDTCRLRGPHNAENLLAALAVGHVLRVPLERMAAACRTYAGRPHCFQLVAEINGVQFINDSKATNPDAMQKAVQAARPAPGGRPNVWLIAGGQDTGLDFHEAGPLLNRRVRQVFLLGEAAPKLRAAWSLFTPCKVVGSLLEAVTEAAARATVGDVVLLSPACSSFDQFRDYQQRGALFCEAVASMAGGASAVAPNIHGESPAGWAGRQAAAVDLPGLL